MRAPSTQVYALLTGIRDPCRRARPPAAVRALPSGVRTLPSGVHALVLRHARLV
jgi:hypothetical protein